MIEIYFRPTSNGHKITICCEETGLPYRLTPIGSLDGGVFNPQFLRISPNNKMPVIVDHAPADGGPPLSVFESGAILVYLADKSGRFLSPAPRARAQTLQWLFWQTSGLGPISGQNGHFRYQAVGDIGTYAAQRFHRELRRLYAVLDHRLRDHEYVAGDYSIADMACHPWVNTWKIQGIDLSEFPHVGRWREQLAARPAVQRAYGAAEPYQPSPRASSDAEHALRYRQTAELLRAAYERMDADATDTPAGGRNSAAPSAATAKPPTPE